MADSVQVVDIFPALRHDDAAESQTLMMTFGITIRPLRISAIFHTS